MLVRGIPHCNSSFRPSPRSSLAKRWQPPLAMVRASLAAAVPAPAAPLQPLGESPRCTCSGEAVKPGAFQLTCSMQGLVFAQLWLFAKYKHFLRDSAFSARPFFQETSTQMGKLKLYLQRGMEIHESNLPFKKRGFYTRNATANSFFRGMFTLQMKKPVCRSNTNRGTRLPRRRACLDSPSAA